MHDIYYTAQIFQIQLYPFFYVTIILNKYLVASLYFFKAY